MRWEHATAARVLAVLWLTPAWAQTSTPAPLTAASLAESASTRPQLAPSLDADGEEKPGDAPELSLGLGSLAPSPAPAEGRQWVRKIEPADFKSSFSEGVLAGAKAAYDQGRFRTALKLLAPEPPSLPVRYLRAMSALELTQWAAAAEGFSSLADDVPTLSDLSHFQAAWAHERLHQWTEALRHYAAVRPGALQYTDARFAMASILEKRKQDYAGATDALAPLVQGETSRPNDPAQAAAWLALARLARYRADYNGEHRAHLAVWALHPYSPEVEAAIKGLRDLPYVPKWKVARAETLLSLHDNLGAMALLERMLPTLILPDELACRAHFAYGTALRKERRHAQAVRVLRPVVELCQDASLRARALFVLGYSESVVEPERGIATYLSLAHDYPEHPYADDALFYAAGKALELGDKPAAMGYLDQLISRYPEGNFVAEALFQRFWVHRADGEHAAALESLTRLEALGGTATSFESLQRARYWHARELLALNRPLEAQTLLAQVATEGASTWYGLLARSRLTQEAPERARAITEQLLAPLAPTEVWPLDAGGLASDPHFLTGLELLRLDNRDAGAELLAARWQGQGEGAPRLLFHLLRVTGYERSARAIARALLREGRVAPTAAETRLVYVAAYPQAFRELVVRHSRSAKVDPDLMQALIREESAFDPHARSSTGALGLAQLMPATASAVAHELKLTLATPEALFEPQQNIRLGSAYLGSLQKRFAGNLPYAVASYNAGPGAVDRWRSRFPQAELDEWVEQIPVEETRLYVKHVLGSAAAYQVLYTTGPLTTLAFGEHGSNNAGSR